MVCALILFFQKILLKQVSVSCILIHLLVIVTNVSHFSNLSKDDFFIFHSVLISTHSYLFSMTTVFYYEIFSSTHK